MPHEMEAGVQMKLYTLSKRKLAVVFLIFVSCFILSVIGALAAPHVICTDKHEKRVEKNDYGAVVFSATTSAQLTSLNQQLWLVATPIPRSISHNASINLVVIPKVSYYYIDNEGREQPVQTKRPDIPHERGFVCESEKCNTLLLLHLGYIDHSKYKVNIELDNADNLVSAFKSFTLEFKNYRSSFTLVEIWFRVAFLALTFIVTIWYTRTLRPYHSKDWSIEQKWMMVLLPLLICYNNPLFPLAFIVASSAPFVLDGMFQATFLSTLLLYYLCIYHSIRKPKRNFLRFYLPKLLLVGLIWLTAVVLSTWQAVNERTDPTYNYRVDTLNFMGFKIVLFVLTALYTLFLLYLVIKAFIELRNVAYFNLRLKFTAIYMVCIFSVSLAILVLRFGTHVLDVSFVSDISTRYGSAAEFLSLYGLLNFSLYTMAYVYSPSSNALSESHLHDNPTITMLNESDDDSESDLIYGGDKDKNIFQNSSSQNGFMSRLDADSD